MTEPSEIQYDDIYPDRPDQARSIAHRLASILRLHRQDPADPESTCLCGYHGNYYGHVARETLVEPRVDGLEVRSGRFI